MFQLIQKVLFLNNIQNIDCLIYFVEPQNIEHRTPNFEVNIMGCILRS